MRESTTNKEFWVQKVAPVIWEREGRKDIPMMGSFFTEASYLGMETQVEFLGMWKAFQKNHPTWSKQDYERQFSLGPVKKLPTWELMKGGSSILFVSPEQSLLLRKMKGRLAPSEIAITKYKLNDGTERVLTLQDISLVVVLYEPTNTSRQAEEATPVAYNYVVVKDYIGADGIVHPSVQGIFPSEPVASRFVHDFLCSHGLNYIKTEEQIGNSGMIADCYCYTASDGCIFNLRVQKSPVFF